jgi:hypothetical protein
MRNKGYLDNLKELKNKLLANSLSLHESKIKELSTENINNYRLTMSKLINYPVLIQSNGLFEINNVKETDTQFILNLLTEQDYIEYINKSTEKLDFSKINIHGIPTKLYKLIGKIKI